MILARIVLLVAAAAFIGIGVGFLLLPRQWAAIVEIAVPTPTARTDLRATYGGFDLGIGVFLALAALDTDWTRSGLMALALASAGFAGGRLLGILAERTASRLMLAFLCIESTTAAVSWYALRQL
jgi:hypothetical protein